MPAGGRRSDLPSTRSASRAFAGERSTEVRGYGDRPGVPLRAGAEPRTKGLGEDGAESRRVRTRSPADAEDVRRVVIARRPHRQGLGAFARGTVADPPGVGLPEPERRADPIRAAFAAVGDDERSHRGPARSAPAAFRSAVRRTFPGSSWVCGTGRGTEMSAASYRSRAQWKHLNIPHVGALSVRFGLTRELRPRKPPIDFGLPSTLSRTGRVRNRATRSGWPRRTSSEFAGCPPSRAARVRSGHGARGTPASG